MIDLLKIADRLADKNRLKKYNHFIRYYSPDSSARILDVGASEDEYRPAANIIEKKYPFPQKITALGIEKYIGFRKRYPMVRAVNYTGGKFPFSDDEFDIVWCNAVLEHVGDRAMQRQFFEEIARVGKKAFVTTPNRYFPFELHTKIFLLHYLPKKYFDKILKLCGKSWAAGDYMHLLSLSEIRGILKDCGITQYKIARNRILGFTVDFIITF